MPGTSVKSRCFIREGVRRSGARKASCDPVDQRNGPKEKLCEFASDAFSQSTFLGGLWDKHSLRVACLDDDTGLANVSDLSVSWRDACVVAEEEYD